MGAGVTDPGYNQAKYLKKQTSALSFREISCLVSF